jgi:Domain of unknown function (DUF4214)/Intracellular proteinase inhibitor
MRRQNRPSVESLEGRALLSNLAYSVTTDKSSYAPGQPVQLTFSETNVSNQDVKIGWGPSIDGFQVSHNGATIWASNEGMNPMFIALQTLAPGQSFTLHATWNGQQDEGTATTPGGMYTVTNQLVLASAANATITIAPSVPAIKSFLPLTSSAAPFGTLNPNLETAEVNGLYNTILGRNPDTAGQAAGLKALRAGTTVAQLAQGMLHSTEYETDLVAADYKTYLGRSGSMVEINGWVARMQSGTTAQQVASGFLMSNEFLSAHTDNTAFVQSLYNDVLGRSANPLELTAALTQLASGTSRQGVVSGLISSTTAETSEINSLYQPILGRLGDTAGIDAALAGLQSGKLSLADLAANLFGSLEYADHAAGTIEVMPG